MYQSTTVKLKYLNYDKGYLFHLSQINLQIAKISAKLHNNKPFAIEH